MAKSQLFFTWLIWLLTFPDPHFWELQILYCYIIWHNQSCNLIDARRANSEIFSLPNNSVLRRYDIKIPDPIRKLRFGQFHHILLICVRQLWDFFVYLDASSKGLWRLQKAFWHFSCIGRIGMQSYRCGRWKHNVLIFIDVLAFIMSRVSIIIAHDSNTVQQLAMTFPHFSTQTADVSDTSSFS